MKVLIVSPFYAPFSLVGARRMISLSMYLQSLGHEVSVMAYGLQTLGKLVSTDVLVTPVPQDIDIIDVEIPRISTNRNINLLLQYNAWAKSLNKIKKNDYDIAIVSVGPEITEKPVRKFAKKCKIPFIMDMRDLDILDCSFNKNASFKSFIKYHINSLFRNVERKCMADSVHVVTVTPGYKDRIYYSYGIPKDKISVIYNGFDDKLLKSCQPIVNEDHKFRIGIFGKFMRYSVDRGEKILQAIHELRINGFDVTLVHVGEGSSNIYDYISDYHLDSDIYTNLGVMDYISGINNMLACNCFCIEYDDPVGLGTKVFDYIFCNKPIICVADIDCYLSKFVNAFANGYSVDSVVEIVNSIKDIFTNNKVCLDDKLDGMEYSRLRQNQEYINILNNILYANKGKN